MNVPGKNIIGLLPAGGRASRMGQLPCSKELFPIGFTSKEERSLPKPVSSYLLESMQKAGIEKVYIIIREGKWDIPQYYGDGSALKLSIGYLLMGLPFGTPFTLDQAFPFVKDHLVALGFPDIIFEPDDAFEKLIEKQQNTQADIALGLFPVEETSKFDMVEQDEHGRIISLHIKPATTTLRYTWGIAVWSPAFTAFMHGYLSNLMKDPVKVENEIYVGHVIQAAIDAGLKVASVTFPEGYCLDIGTPGDMKKAILRFS